LKECINHEIRKGEKNYTWTILQIDLRKSVSYVQKKCIKWHLNNLFMWISDVWANFVKSLITITYIIGRGMA
jgi:hypothetical protein